MFLLLVINSLILKCCLQVCDAATTRLLLVRRTIYVSTAVFVQLLSEYRQVSQIARAGHGYGFAPRIIGLSILPMISIQGGVRINDQDMMKHDKIRKTLFKKNIYPVILFCNKLIYKKIPENRYSTRLTSCQQIDLFYQFKMAARQNIKFIFTNNLTIHSSKQKKLRIYSQKQRHPLCIMCCLESLYSEETTVDFQSTRDNILRCTKNKDEQLIVILILIRC